MPVRRTTSNKWRRDWPAKLPDGVQFLEAVTKVHVYQRWSAFPFLEREVAIFTIDDADDVVKTCSDALNAYVHGRGAL
jgi:hypothetical protein